jgi:hypothetical protein
MNKLLCGALSLALTIAVAGCNPATTTTVQQDAATAAAVAEIFACDVSTVANVAAAVELAVNSGGQVFRAGTTTKIVNVSSTFCKTLQGVATTATATEAATATAQ